MSGRRASVALIAASLSLIGTAACAVWFSVRISRGTLTVNDQLASVASFYVGVAVLVGTLVSFISRSWPRPSILSSENLAAAVGELQGVVQGKLQEERSMRFIYNPGPLDLVWLPWNADGLTSTGDTVTPSQVQAGGGKLTDLAKLFLKDREVVRLVILGDAGSGKTTSTLILASHICRQLGRRRKVPIVLNLATWKPASEGLRAWALRQFAAEYYGGDRTIPSQLIRANRILFVLDGLDEVDTNQSDEILRSVDQAFLETESFVITCGTAAYRVLVTLSPAPVATSIVALQDVSLEDATAYVASSVLAIDRGWSDLLAYISSNPTSTLATALRQPLALTLLCLAYKQRSPDVKELISESKSSSVVGIQKHLAAEFIAAAYGRPTKTFEQFTPTLRRWPRPKAMKWHHFLASELADVVESGEMNWYMLAYISPRAAFIAQFIPIWATFGIVVGISRASVTAGITAMLLVGLFSHRTIGFLLLPSDMRKGVSALSFVLIDSLPALTMGPTDQPPQYRLRRARRRTLLQGIGAGFASAAICIFTFGAGSSSFLVAASTFVAFVLCSRWGRYSVARISLAIRGKVPWRFQAFSADAYRRGIFRRAGVGYTYRHEWLRESLASGVSWSLVQAMPPGSPGEAGSWAADSR